MKLAVLTLTAVFLLNLAGCAPPTHEDLYQNLEQFISNISMYYCIADMYVGKGENKTHYLIKQWYMLPDKYRLEILLPGDMTGKTIVKNGNTVWIDNPRLNEFYQLENIDLYIEDKIFPGSFLQCFMEGEAGTREVVTIGDGQYILLETHVPGLNKNFRRQRLWIDARQMVPYMLKVYDNTEEAVIEVRYRDFSQDINMDIQLFER
ncbi:MAG TPA: outer membrane lipoprotein carrier protein LolA [Clostridiales bacterium]|nr:outer membrane lipoprotein carrier protein LolA [Clostridiales bacterium]